MKYAIFLIAAMLAAGTLMVGATVLPQQVFAGGGGDESTTETEPKSKVDCTTSGFKYSVDCASQAHVDTDNSDINQ